ncbi:helix-turn-helix domain-containing protein [Accumulibacter sp.]|uniref:helix-turn-helix domain-containing protein n=1 Tax=Accumulibacter sp. TaxID=2053492 RepID=UPI002D1FA09D|nr:helix-turn-helix domain-containing protein [Accumulibacter sp.]
MVTRVVRRADTPLSPAADESVRPRSALVDAAGVDLPVAACDSAIVSTSKSSGRGVWIKAGRNKRPTSVTAATKAELLALAEDLPCLWDHPGSSPQIKKRLLRTVLKDIIATSEDNAIRLVLHWQGGDHTELRFEKIRTGKHRYVMDTDTIELIRSLARIQPDAMIASILNRMGRHTPHGQTWTAVRVCATRNNHAIAVYREGERQTRGELSVSEVAAILSVTQTTVLRMIRLRHMPATQACVNAPWVVRQDDLDRYLADHCPAGRPQTSNPNQLSLAIQ